VATGRRWDVLHTILLDPTNARRMYVAISAAGAFRSDDSGTSWKPINRGLHSQYIPDPTPRSATACTHRRCTARVPTLLFKQKLGTHAVGRRR